MAPTCNPWRATGSAGALGSPSSCRRRRAAALGGASAASEALLVPPWSRHPARDLRRCRGAGNQTAQNKHQPTKNHKQTYPPLLLSLPRRPQAANVVPLHVWKGARSRNPRVKPRPGTRRNRRCKLPATLTLTIILGIRGRIAALRHRVAPRTPFDQELCCRGDEDVEDRGKQAWCVRPRPTPRKTVRARARGAPSLARRPALRGAGYRSASNQRALQRVKGARCSNPSVNPIPGTRRSRGARLRNPNPDCHFSGGPYRGAEAPHRSADLTR